MLHFYYMFMNEPMLGPEVKKCSKNNNASKSMVRSEAVERSDAEKVKKRHF